MRDLRDDEMEIWMRGGFRWKRQCQRKYIGESLWGADEVLKIKNQRMSIFLNYVKWDILWFFRFSNSLRRNSEPIYSGDAAFWSKLLSRTFRVTPPLLCCGRCSWLCRGRCPHSGWTWRNLRCIWKHLRIRWSVPEYLWRTRFPAGTVPFSHRRC